jgi:RNA polymerase sigma-70 factor (ECF subfamily)
MPEDTAPESPESSLPRFVETARAAWPELGVDTEAFARYAASRPLPPLTRAADLFIAYACAAGLPDAQRAIDPALRSAATETARRIDPAPAFADDVTQALREKLLASQPPKIGEYEGRAALGTWLRVIALRTAMNMRRRKGDQPGARVAPTSNAPGGEDLELAYLRDRYRPHFAGAIEEALAALTPRERMLLKLTVSNGLGIEKIGSIYNVGKSTAARWLTAAREHLVEVTRERLRARLGTTDSEYASLAALVRSQLEVSVARLLEEQAD